MTVRIETYKALHPTGTEDKFLARAIAVSDGRGRGDGPSVFVRGATELKARRAAEKWLEAERTRVEQLEANSKQRAQLRAQKKVQA